jgi:hypothetical protein
MGLETILDNDLFICETGNSSGYKHQSKMSYCKNKKQYKLSYLLMYLDQKKMMNDPNSSRQILRDYHSCSTSYIGSKLFLNLMIEEEICCNYI